MAPPPAGDQPAGQQRSTGIFGSIFKALVLWFIFKNLFGGGGGGAPSTKNAPREQQLWPKFERGEPIDMAFYLAETPYPSELGRLEPIWDLKGIPLADTKEWTISHLYKPSKV